MREILYTVSRKIDPLAEFPSLDTEQSRFVYQKAGSLAFAQSLFSSGSAGLGGTDPTDQTDRNRIYDPSAIRLIGPIGLIYRASIG
jgi:hypothetical protein